MILEDLSIFSLFQTADIPNIQSALTAGAHQAGSTLPPTIEKVHTNEMHPTYNR